PLSRKLVFHPQSIKAECYGVAVWRGNVLATVCTASLLLAATVFADERGWLLGSAGFFGKQFLGDAAKATIIVECRGKTTTIQTDERGDYAVQLDACKYHLLKVLAADGRKLRIHSRQVRKFVITDG